MATPPAHPGASLTVWLTEKVIKSNLNNWDSLRPKNISNCFMKTWHRVFWIQDNLHCIEIICSGEQNGYNIPEMSPAPEVEKILSESSSADFKSSRANSMGEQVKRLCSDAYMCFYQSPDVRMYR